MSIIKPYTFVGGTKARAIEVNANFDRLYDQVNTNITNITNAQTDITNLGINKANVAGNSTQRFAVADATSSYDAVNKQTLTRSIANTIDVITGFQISKDSNSPTDTILVSKGSCYDNTKSVVLTLDALTSKQNSTQAANATYYVYIIGNATGSLTDIIISIETSVPTLPSGYTLYRQIGYYTTDANNNIADIVYYGVDISSNKNPNASINLGMPDFTRGIGKTAGIVYVADRNGYIVCTSTSSVINAGYLTIDGVNVCGQYGISDAAGVFTFISPVGKGSSYIGQGYVSITFYPCRGEV